MPVKSKAQSRFVFASAAKGEPWAKNWVKKYIHGHDIKDLPEKKKEKEAMNKSAGEQNLDIIRAIFRKVAADEKKKVEPKAYDSKAKKPSTPPGVADASAKHYQNFAQGPMASMSNVPPQVQGAVAKDVVGAVGKYAPGVTNSFPATTQKFQNVPPMPTREQISGHGGTIDQDTRALYGKGLTNLAQRAGALTNVAPNTVPLVQKYLQDPALGDALYNKSDELTGAAMKALMQRAGVTNYPSRR